MKKVVEITVRSSDEYEPRDYLKIEVDGKSKFRLGPGEPEDMTINRDLGVAYDVLPLIKWAYEQGLNGEKLEFYSKEIADTEDDEY